MHEEKVALTKNQIAALRRAAETRSIQDIFVVACGGSLATLYPILYILDRETNAVHVSSVNAAEFFHNPPHRLGDHSLVILNSQSNTGDRFRRPCSARTRGAYCGVYHSTRLRYRDCGGFSHLLL